MNEQSDSLRCYLAARWLRWRHGNVYAIAPPLGWSKYAPASLWHKCKYWPKCLVWCVESWLLGKYGHSLRSAWEQSCKRSVTGEQIKDVMFNSIACVRFMHDRKAECFQMQGRYDGSITDECKEAFRKEHDFWDAMIEESRSR
jgi:hypothetical protein